MTIKELKEENKRLTEKVQALQTNLARAVEEGLKARQQKLDRDKDCEFYVDLINRYRDEIEDRNIRKENETQALAAVILAVGSGLVQESKTFSEIEVHTPKNCFKADYENA